MHAALALSLVVAMEAAPVAPITISPIELVPVGIVPELVPVELVPAAPVAIERDDVDDRYTRTAAVLGAFADEGKAARITGAVASGLLAAGLIGVGVTYVAVGNLDGQLSQKDYEDTELAGAVMGGAALVPIAVMIAHLLSSSPEEERFAAFDGATGADQKQARIESAQQSLVRDASSSSLAPTLGGLGFIGGGLLSAAVGGVFLALPHIPDVERGPMTHATGAELIGGGVAAVGLGTALLFSTGTTAPLQLRLLATAP